MVFVLLLSRKRSCRPLYHVHYHFIPFYARVFIEDHLRVNEKSAEENEKCSIWLKELDGQELRDWNSQNEDVVLEQGMTGKLMRWADWFFG